MHTFTESTTMVGLSELRAKWPDVRQAMRKSRVVVSRRNVPDAVLLSLEQYEEMMDLLERVEDYALALKAREREKKSSRKDFIPLSEALKKL